MATKKSTKTTDEVRRSVGRPSKYEPWMCDAVITVGEDGGHIYDMCKAIDVASFETFYNWIKTYPDFGKAVSKAKLASITWWLRVNKGIALGEIKGNHSAVMAILKNKDTMHFNAEENTTKTVNVTHSHVISDEQYTALLQEAKRLTKDVN
jgi:hypothetical protein